MSGCRVAIGEPAILRGAVAAPRCPPGRFPAPRGRLLCAVGGWATRRRPASAGRDDPPAAAWSAFWHSKCRPTRLLVCQNALLRPPTLARRHRWAAAAVGAAPGPDRQRTCVRRPGDPLRSAAPMSGHDARPDQPSGGRHARRGERHGAGRMPRRDDALHGPNDQPAGRAEARVSRYDHVDDFAARHAALDDDAPGAAGLLGPSADPTTRGLLSPSADPAAGDQMSREERWAWREERRRAAARRRRQRLLRRAVPFGAVVVLLGAGAGVLLAGDDTPTKPAGEQRTADDLGAQTAAAGPLAVTRELGGLGSGGPTLQLAGARNAFEIDWKVPPRAGLVFDLDDGRVLWRKNALKPLPIASVTKMMTALVVTDTSRRSRRSASRRRRSTPTARRWACCRRQVDRAVVGAARADARVGQRHGDRPRPPGRRRLGAAVRAQDEPAR